MIARVTSAVLAGVGVLLVGLYGGPKGLFFACVGAIVITTLEFARMIFPRYRLPMTCAPLLLAAALGAIAAIVKLNVEPALAFGLAYVAFSCATLWIARGRVTNDDLWPALASAAFGLLYCGLFPSFAARLCLTPGGPSWFAALLVVVFTGDIGAFFTGRAVGGPKFMPNLSPNKTWSGSLGGLISSAVGGTAFLAYVRPELSVSPNVFFSLACGFAAQNGDLLVSLVKRVAGVKDSGRIMPGHGGLLDRLDGIFIACPLVYAFSLWAAQTSG